MKKLIVFSTALIFAMTVATSVMAADPPAAPEGEIEISNFGKKGVVKFNHATHTETDCKSCHHKAEEGKAIAKCGDCHKLEDGDAMKIKDAFHKKEVGQCWSCHFKKSPTVVKAMKCKDCHG